MFRPALLPVVALLSTLSLGRIAQAQAPPAPARSLVGFWTVNPEAMRADPRFKATLESQEGRAGIGFADGVLFEFTADSRLRIHVGAANERTFTLTPHENGTFHFRTEDSQDKGWIIEFISPDRFVQKFEDRPNEVLWSRSWDPLVGTWRIDAPALDEEGWYKGLADEARRTIEDEIESLHVSIAPDGSFDARWASEDREGAVRFESTTPPAAALLESGQAKPAAHLVRREDGTASLYLGTRTFPLERTDRPSLAVPGTWKFDLQRAMTLDWLKQSVPEGQTLEQFIRSNVKLDTLVVVTPDQWNGQAYVVRDERANQFSVEVGGQLVFWVRVIDEGHISQMPGGGREFPLVRAGAAPPGDTGPAGRPE